MNIGTVNVLLLSAIGLKNSIHATAWSWLPTKKILGSNPLVAQKYDNIIRVYCPLKVEASRLDYAQFKLSYGLPE
jgi:hypothetical protein